MDDRSRKGLLKTTVGDADRAFPSTHWTIIQQAARRESPGFGAAVESLAQRYWRPVYAYIRRRWNKPSDVAKDLTQEFFLALCEREFLRQVRPDHHGRFRSYVMKALDNLVREQYRSDRRQKRGGGRRILSIDSVPVLEPSDGTTPEEAFRREWIRSLMEGALHELSEEYQRKGWEERYKIFRWRDIDSPKGADLSYEGLAERFHLPVGEVKNILYLARLRLRHHILERIRETADSDAEAREEMKELFGGGKS